MSDEQQKNSIEKKHAAGLNFVHVDPDSFVTYATLMYWQRHIHQWAATKGWNQDLEERSFGDWMQLLVTEISEAYEDYRNHKRVNEIYHEVVSQEDGRVIAKPCGIPIEIADLAIRMLHFCEHFGIDLNEMIALKMKYNETREYRHGGKKV